MEGKVEIVDVQEVLPTDCIPCYGSPDPGEEGDYYDGAGEEDDDDDNDSYISGGRYLGRQ